MTETNGPGREPTLSGRRYLRKQDRCEDCGAHGTHDCPAPPAAPTNGPGREPTQEMLAAVAKFGVSPAHPHLGLLPGTAANIWRAMWDAALPPAETPAPAPADALVEALELVLAQSGADQGAPDHCHSKPGVWDNDSGNRSVGRAGQVCRECGVWDRARAALARPAGAKEST